MYITFPNSPIKSCSEFYFNVTLTCVAHFRCSGKMPSNKPQSNKPQSKATVFSITWNIRNDNLLGILGIFLMGSELLINPRPYRDRCGDIFGHCGLFWNQFYYLSSSYFNFSVLALPMCPRNFGSNMQGPNTVVVFSWRIVLVFCLCVLYKAGVTLPSLRKIKFKKLLVHFISANCLTF